MKLCAARLRECKALTNGPGLKYMRNRTECEYKYKIDIKQVNNRATELWRAADALCVRKSRNHTSLLSFASSVSWRRYL